MATLTSQDNERGTMFKTLTRRRSSGMRKLLLGVCAAAAVASAGATWFEGAGTALAPEPVRLTEDLGGYNGATGAAIDTSSRSTEVVKFPGSYTPDSSLPAGKPCSTTWAPAGYETAKVIVRTGNYAKCV